MENKSSTISIVIPVYRDAPRATTLVHALERQQLPAGTSTQIIVVDDGSNDGSYEHMEEALKGLSQVVLVRLPVNEGRSAARNAGAVNSSGDVLFFIDCDCLPMDTGLLAGHLKLMLMEANVVATVGPVTGNEDGFWHRYQMDASLRRAHWHAAGMTYAGSSQNMAVRRDAFMASGGFDRAYRAYGFEDRDLLLRLARIGLIGWVPDSAVRHTDLLNAASVSRKMREAGGEGAILFSRRHPEAYRRLGYAALDARQHRWLQPLAFAADHVLGPLVRVTDSIVPRNGWSYAFKRRLVKLVTALSYLAGTRH